MNDGTTPWLRQHRRQSAPGLPPSVALCRALQLGDMLCAVSARRALRAALPATRITLVGLPWTTQFASHFAGNIDDFVAFPGYDAFPEQHVQQHKLADFYAGIRARRFDMAIRQLGGSSIVATAVDMQLGRGETIADTARVVGRMVDAIMLRSNTHATLETLADHAGVPVINALTDISHPCQVLADIMTFEERAGHPVAGSCWAYLGDGNNMANSLIEAASVLGFDLKLGVPHGYDPDQAVLATAGCRGGSIDVVRSAAAAVEGAQVVVTDTWVSMGQTIVKDKLAALAPGRCSCG